MSEPAMSERDRRMRVNLNMPTGTTLLLIDEDGDRRSMFKQLLREGGYSIAAAVNTVAKLGDAVRQHKPDAIVISTGQPSRRLLEQIAELKNADRRPVVLFSEDDRSETMQSAIAAGVNAYIVLGLSSNRVRTGVDLAFINFTQTETLRGKVAEAANALRERKLIERAKGIIMKQRQIDEDAAYALLRDRAMQQAMRIAEVARMIIDATELLTEASDGKS